MDKVFISSVITGFEAERQAARDAIESLDLRPLMAETTASSPDPSRTALLGQIDRADAVVLLLAGWYGYVGENGRSPTEDEYNHAVRTGKPVLAFVHEGVEREPAQDEFIARVRGPWERDGVLTSSFTGPSDLTLKVVRSLHEQRNRNARGDAVPVAGERATSLAGAQDRYGSSLSGAVRVAFVPVAAGVLLDAFALDDETLPDRVISAARARGVISQTSGATSQLTSAGIVVSSDERGSGPATQVVFADDGAVCVTFAAGCDGLLGSMAISAPRVSAGIEAAGLLAQDLWRTVEGGDEVRRVCATVGVPHAHHVAYSLSGTVGSSLSVGADSAAIVAPQPSAILPRAVVGTPESALKLTVPLKRAFADTGSVRD